MSKTRSDKALPPLQQSEQSSPLVITESDLRGLPEVVQRYLRYTQILGKRPSAQSISHNAAVFAPNKGKPGCRWWRNNRIRCSLRRSCGMAASNWLHWYPSPPEISSLVGTAA